MGQKAFSDDYAVRDSPNSRTTLLIVNPSLSENLMTHISEFIYEMLEREPQKRPSIPTLVSMIESYCRMLGWQVLIPIPEYDQWKKLVNNGSREPYDLLFQLARWYYTIGQNEAEMDLLASFAKRFPDLRSQKRLAKHT
jgi:hypothetical protein